MAAAGQITIRVTLGELDGAKNRFDNDFIPPYRRLYEHFYASTIAQLKQMWTGDANVEFIKKIEGFEDDFTALCILMEKLSAFIAAAKRLYETNEDALAGEAKGLSSGNTF